MKTNATAREAGVRWQQIVTPEQAEKFRGKRLVFVGLGNSTAEMMLQIEEYNKQGYGIDYLVLTHYPDEAVHNPTKDVVIDGKEYRVARDLTKPNLVKFEYDLAPVKAVYDKAVTEGKIWGDVKEWNVNGKQMTIAREGHGVSIVDFAQNYTLIGYGHDKQTLEAMGMNVVDEYYGTIARDFDGEIQREPGATGRERVHAGYFGLGAVLRDHQYDPNAIVIPGMFHRGHDFLFSVVMRATEYQQRQRRR
jgi:hypothetical protein